MKANAPRRNIFSDAVDLLGGSEAAAVVASENGVRMLPIDCIRPFREHPFRLYEGERLEDMVESIPEHGILVPVIVWQHPDGYEMLSGHNRQAAGKLAGLTEVSAIVKTDLTERYEKVSNQGKRNDILEEIARLNGADMEGTCGHDVHKLKSREAIGEEYGMTGRNIARYLRVSQLEQPLKDRLDAGELPLVVAVDLSYLSGEVTEEKVLEVLGGRREKKNAGSLRQAVKSIQGHDVFQMNGRKRVRQ